MSQKKGKKKGRKKDDDDWEDEVANEVEQMKLSEKNDLQVQNETDDHEEAEKTKKKKKKGKKGKGSMDSDNEDDDEVSGKDKGSKSSFGLLDVEDVEEKDEVVNKQIKTKQTKEDNRTKTEKLSNKNQEAVFDDKNNESVKNLGTGNEKEVTEINSDNEYEFDVKKEKRKAKKTKAKTEEEDIELNLEEESTVKTAAQKRAEKKEREKKKKDAQKKKAKDTKASKNETEKADDHSGEGFEGTGGEEKKEKPVNEDENAVAVNQVAEEGAGGEFGPVDNEKEDHEEGDEKKKKKKKKKKAKEDEPPKTKKPGKAMIKQIQEAREKARLEEERLRQEEEAKQRAFEEAEKKRLEKIRLEQERKDKQKQKEKKRKEKLKKEGKLLTKAQKQQKAQAEAMLQAMRETGISIPSRSNAESSEVKKPVRYGKKRTKQGPEKSDTADTEQNEAAEDATATTSLDVQEFKEEDVKEENAEKSESDDDDVNDTWDADEDDEESVTEDSVTKKEKDSKEIDEEEKEEEGDDTSEEDEEEENEEDDASEEDEDALEDGTESDSKESDEDDSLSKEERDFARAKARITKRREKAEAKRSKEKLRSPVICVMGHVDTGKTKILDKIRHSHVQDGEAGGITQQIGATNVPSDAVRTQTRMIKDFSEFEMKMPGLLIIDTPGHESFSNLRSRGSTLCDMAILVVDIMHGLEPQTIESINLLRTKKTPFVVALNKVDRLFEWKRGPNSSIVDTLKKQNRNTKQEFEERLNQIVGEFANEGLNAALFHKNVDEKSYISLVPTSAHTGDGMGDLIALIVKLCQTKLAHRLAFSEELQCTVLEVKAITGLGTTVDVILTNGRLAESQTIVLGGIEGAIVTQVRTLLMPQPLKELRVKNQYATFKEIEAAQGVKITGKELDKALAGSPLFVAYQEDEIEVLKKEVSEIVQQSLKSIKVSERGVCVQASTLGSLEALLEFLKTSKIPYCSVSVGPVHKRDVMKASVMLEHDNLFAVILAFDVKVERDAQELADNLGVKIFTADIIYHLFDRFTNYREELKQKKRDEFKHIAIFPCKLRILSEHIYNSRDPIVVGVAVEAGIVKEGTPICVPSKEFVDVGIVTGIEANHKALEKATKGMEVCVKIEPVPGEAPKLYGRHFDYTDLLISKISRESIDACKNYFRDDLQKSDWQLMIELKKLFKII